MPSWRQSSWVTVVILGYVSGASSGAQRPT